MRFRSICLASLCMFATLSLSACGEGAADDDAPHRVVYQTRGRIVALPVPNSPASELQIFHEEIPSFLHTWPDGALGMNAMVMPFPLAPGVDVEGFDVGDKVEFSFEVEYHHGTGALSDYRVVELESLPPDVELDLGRPESDIPPND